MRDPLRILILEDNPADAELVQFELGEAGLVFTSKVVMTEEDFVHGIQESCPDLILSDYDLPKYNGALALAEARRSCPDTPFILVTGAVSEDRAIEILTQGAKDYVLKHRLQQRLVPAIKRALAESEEHRARKKAEAELREAHRLLEKQVQERTAELWDSRERLSLALASSGMGIFELDIVENRRYWDNFVCRLLGIKPENFTGTSEEFFRVVHPDDRQTVQDAIRKAIERDGSYETEYRAIWPDSSVHHVAARGKVLCDNAGRPARIVGACWEITERRQIEEVQEFLAQSGSGTRDEPFFNSLARFLAQKLGMDFVCIDRLEEEGLIARTVAVWCDGHFQDNVTYALKDTPCGEVVGKAVCCFPASVCQFFPRDQVLKDLRAESYAGVTLFGHTGQPIGLIAVIGRRPLANRTLAEAVLKLVAGRAVGEMERLDAEEALRESEERFRSLSDASLEGIMIHEQGVILDANLSFARLFGYEQPEELIGRNGLDFLLTPESKARIRQRMEQQEIGPMEMTGVRKDGTEFEAETESQPVRYLGHDARIVSCRNITERKRAEERMQRYELLAAYARDIVLFIRRDDGRIMEANVAAMNAYGYTRDELLALTIHDLRAPDAQALTTGQLDKAEKQGILFEIRYRRKDGTLFPAEVSSRGANIGGVRMLISVIRDITERKQAEYQKEAAIEALRESEERYRALIDSAPDAIVVHSRGNVVYANPAAIDLYGADSLERLESTNITTLVPTEDSEMVADRMRMLNEGKTLPLHEAAILRFNGEKVPVDMISIPVQYGGIKATQTIMRDITERKRAGAELARLALFPMLSPNIVIEVDLEGTVHFCNPAAEKLFPDLRHQGLAHPLLANWEAITRSFCEGGLKEGTRELNVHGRWYQQTTHFVEEKKRVHIYGRDITLRKETEKELMKRATELENINKELESFSYSVSHDLRAPLRAIEGYSRMILKKEGERFSEETQRQFQLIRDNAETMGLLIEDLLDFSRLTKHEIVKRSVDMEELAGEVWQELVTINPCREMTLKISQMPAACGDRTLVRQVYSNLLGNAVKFAQGRTPAVLEAGSRVKNGETVYYVRDNGVGFDMRFYDKLFVVFQRLHIDKEFKGTGIGLALVQRIIHRHGGKIWAEGEVDKGATFYFTLPTQKD